MTLDEYQAAAAITLKPQCRNKEYLSLGLAGEAGEFCDKMKKIIRGDGQLNDAVLHELGDCLWYVSQLAGLFNVSLEQIAQMNLDKLNDRQNRGVIAGSGDKR